MKSILAISTVRGHEFGFVLSFIHASAARETSALVTPFWTLIRSRWATATSRTLITLKWPLMWSC